MRLDGDQFHREIAQAAAEVEALDGKNVDIDIKADSHHLDQVAAASVPAARGLASVTDASRKLDRGFRDVERIAPRATSHVSMFSRSLMGIPAPVLIAGAVTAFAAVGPVAGAAAGAVGVFTGATAGAILAIRGLQAEFKSGSAIGQALETELTGLRGEIDRLSATAASASAGGVLSGFAQAREFLPEISDEVRDISHNLGVAFSVGTGGLITGLKVAMPLLQDGGRYAAILAQKFADFAASQDFADFIDYAREELPKVGAALESVVQGTISLARALAPVGDDIVEIINLTGKLANALGPAIGVATSVSDLAGGGLIPRLFGSRDKNKDAAEVAVKAVNDTTSAVANLNPVLDENARRYGTTATALKTATDAQGKQADAAAQATLKMQLENDAAGILKQSLDLLNGEALSAAEAQNAFESSLVNMGKATKRGARELKGMSKESIDLRGQLNSQIQNLQRVVEANGGLENSTGAARKQMKDMRQQIIDNAVAHGIDRGAVTAYVDELLKIPAKIPPTELDVEKKKAEDKIKDFKELLDSLHSKHITVSATVLQGTLNKLAANPALISANGNIFPSVKAYATGGMENHVAQIAPAGPVRIWAEPETGGEAYIPLAPSKRARSVAIWQETGERLGVSDGGRTVSLDHATIMALAAAMSRVQVRSVVSAGAVEHAVAGGLR